MKIYKFLQHGKWPVLVAAKNRSKAKYALYRFAQFMSDGGYHDFMECILDFEYAGIISLHETKALMQEEECDFDFDFEME